MAANITLIGKPWRGGLARYVLLALQSLYPGQVRWLPVYPDSARQRWRYLRDRRVWRERLTDRIEAITDGVCVFLNTLQEFRRLPARDYHVLWLTDSANCNAEQLAPYRRVFVCDPGYGDGVALLTKPATFAGVLPFAYLPEIHHGQAGMGAPTRDLCFIGNADRKRDTHLSALFACGLRPTVVGNYFLRHRLFWRYPGCHRPAVDNQTMGRIYAQHRLSLNIHAEVVRAGTNMRTFECAGYGIPQIVEQRNGLDEYFQPAREIVTYSEPAELPEVVTRALAEPARMQRMAEHALNRARLEHTYQHRVRTLLAGL